MKTEQHTEAKLKNFTPLLDELVQKFGVITAAVWGRVWRYAQQENHVCQASHEKIANELSISSRTVIRHMQILCSNGYLFDHTPGLKNVPHTYSITQKARILITVEGVTESHTSMTESHSKNPVGVTESQSGYDSVSHEETIKETIKRSRSKADPRTDKPAIKLYKGLAGRLPNKSNYDEIILAFGDSPDGERAAECYRVWNHCGYNPFGLGWLDWYTNGIPERKGGNKKAPATSAQRPATVEDPEGGLRL